MSDDEHSESEFYYPEEIQNVEVEESWQADENLERNELTYIAYTYIYKF